MNAIEPYCSGTHCPLKENCLHYKTNINYSIDAYWSYPPYDATKQKCSGQLRKDGSNMTNSLSELVKRLKNGEGDNHI